MGQLRGACSHETSQASRAACSQTIELEQKHNNTPTRHLHLIHAPPLELDQSYNKASAS